MAHNDKRAKKKLDHLHLMYRGTVGRQDFDDTPETGEKFMKFLYQLIKFLDMEILGREQEGRPRVIYCAEKRFWTLDAFITTSNIIFVYSLDKQEVQVDIYSCKKYQREKTLEFINKFWQGQEVHSRLTDRKLFGSVVEERHVDLIDRPDSEPPYLHLMFNVVVGKENLSDGSEETGRGLEAFLYKLIGFLGLTFSKDSLGLPRAVYGPQNHAWTFDAVLDDGTNICFHYFIDDKDLEGDIRNYQYYHSFKGKKIIEFITEFWEGEHENIHLINRENFASMPLAA